MAVFTLTHTHVTHGACIKYVRCVYKACIKCRGDGVCASADISATGLKRLCTNTAAALSLPDCRMRLRGYVWRPWQALSGGTGHSRSFVEKHRVFIATSSFLQSLKCCGGSWQISLGVQSEKKNHSPIFYIEKTSRNWLSVFTFPFSFEWDYLPSLSINSVTLVCLGPRSWYIFFNGGISQWQYW